MAIGDARALFSGPFRVSDAQIYVLDSGTEFSRISEAFPREGRRCGDRVPGVLFLITALEFGTTTVEVTLSGSGPEMDDTAWAVVEDAIFTARGDVALLEWAGEHSEPLDLPGQYRVRFRQAPASVSPQEEMSGLETGNPVGRTWLHFTPDGRQEAS